MEETGWANMDMDFIRYFITLLKTYYPYFVNYLIIYEMPWLLNGKCNHSSANLICTSQTL